MSDSWTNLSGLHAGGFPPISPMSFADVVRHTGGRPGAWYLGSPYSKYHLGLEAAWIEACKIAGWFAAARVPVYSPIVHSHPVAIYGGHDPLDYDIWMPLNMAAMNSSEGIIVAMMEGWRESFGLSEEIKFYEKRRQPIFYLRVAS